MNSQKLLRFYYLVGTPAFVMLDVFFGINIRAAGLENLPAWKFGYYAICMGTGAVMVWKPQATSLCGLAECSANILVLILGILVPILQMPDAVLAGTPVNLITPSKLANFVISGSMLTLGFYRNPLVRQGQPF